MDKATPLVTVVTVTYNSSAYVADAIESILHSSYTHFELIVGDDCSTDTTWSIVQSYTDDRIHSYRNDKNLGEYANRNKAISLARGEYLIFIDGDDMIYPHGLEFMVRMLAAFPDCAMALMRWFQNDLFFPVVITPEQFYTGEYFGYGFLGTAFSNVLFNTNILKKEGSLSSRYKSGDNYIRYKIAAKYPSLIINDGLTWWRETPGQASQQFTTSREHVFESFRMKFEFLDSASCPLPKESNTQARKNLLLLLSKIFVKELMRLHFRYAFQIASQFKLPVSTIFNCFRKPLRINPFSSYSSTHPYRVAFQANPYSNSIK